MLVDSSGSRKPLASPTLTTLPIQLRLRLDGTFHWDTRPGTD